MPRMNPLRLKYPDISALAAMTAGIESYVHTAPRQVLKFDIFTLNGPMLIESAIKIHTGRNPRPGAELPNELKPFAEKVDELNKTANDFFQPSPDLKNLYGKLRKIVADRVFVDGFKTIIAAVKGGTFQFTMPQPRPSDFDDPTDGLSLMGDGPMPFQSRISSNPHHDFKELLTILNSIAKRNTLEAFRNNQSSRLR